jgi:hypothetical protein
MYGEYAKFIKSSLKLDGKDYMTDEGLNHYKGMKAIPNDEKFPLLQE